MKKTWRRIIIISLILVLFEVAGTMIFLHPYYKIQTVFNGIDNGNWIETQECYDSLGDKQKQKVQTYLDDYATFITGEYLSGKLDYQLVAAMFDAINSIDESKTISNTYMTSINHNEYKLAIKRIYAANTAYDTEAAYDAQMDISSLHLRMDNATREAIMIELLNEEYLAFLNEEISADTVKSYADIIAGISYYDAYAYVPIVKSNVDYVVQYRGLYTTATIYTLEQKYFEAMDICKQVHVDSLDTAYAEKYATLYQNAYDSGKVYYSELLDSYTVAKDKANTALLIELIQLYYGDDFDVSGAEEAMLEDWESAYVTFLENYEVSLQTDLNKSEEGQYILMNQYENLRPNSMFLYDIDKNGVAELFLFNDAYAEDDYTGCFVYGYQNNTPTYIGFVNVRNFCSGSHIVAFPNAFDRESGDEYSLIAYDGATFTVEKYCQHIGEVYYVDGEEVDDVEFLSAQSDILATVNEIKIKNSGYVSITDGKKYIMEY